MERFGARRGLTGEVLEPVFAATAAALAERQVSPEHAAEIAAAVEALPSAVRAEQAAPVEAALLEQAKSVDPQAVRLLGRRVLAHLDPDGPTPSEQRLAHPTAGSPSPNYPTAARCWMAGCRRPAARSGKPS